MDFMQLPPSHGWKYVLVMVRMFSHWIEASPCSQGAASSLGVNSVRKDDPTWGTRLELDSEQIIHFTHQVIRQVSAVWRV